MGWTLSGLHEASRREATPSYGSTESLWKGFVMDFHLTGLYAWDIGLNRDHGSLDKLRTLAAATGRLYIDP